MGNPLAAFGGSILFASVSRLKYHQNRNLLMASALEVAGLGGHRSL
jgi:hypothetical protein